jgi:RNA polymerase sigma-70 factor, ECF subfamily
MPTVVESANDAGDRRSPWAAQAPDLEVQLEQHRPELTVWCRRMVGPFEADDAVQETLLRAWLGLDGFEGRATLRSWLYRIAYNVCLDILDAKSRQAHGLEALASNLVLEPLVRGEGQATLVGIPTGDVDALENPAEAAVARETVRFAFAALICLPSRQRAVLILRDVLRWRAVEVAGLLGTSVASVNSALQRARSTLAAREPSPTEPCPTADVALRELLARCLDAFERHDVELLTALLRDDTRNAAAQPGSRQDR